MFNYSIVLLSVSKYSLSRAVYDVQSSLLRYYKHVSYVVGKFAVTPLLEVSSTDFKRLVRTPVSKTRFSVIRSPFVYKKAGETFVFTSYRASVFVSGRPHFALGSFSTKDLIRFILNRQGSPSLFSNVELRVVATNTFNVPS